MATHGLTLTLALILVLALVITLAPLQARGQLSDPPPVVSCGIDQIIIRETDRGQLTLLEFDPPPFGLTYSTLIDQNVDWSPNIVIQFNLTLAIGADVKVHRESLNNPSIASWTAVTTRHLDVPTPNVEITCNVPVTFFIHVVQVVDGEGRIDQCDYRYRVTYTKPCPTVFGDPQFAGLRGQSYQVHGIDGAVYSLISAPDYLINSRFQFLEGPRPCPVMPTTGRKSVACWSHSGSYLGSVGLLTSSGQAIELQSGAADAGFAAVRINGRELAVNEVVELTSASGAVIGAMIRNSTHEVTINVGVFGIELENNDFFVNLRAVRVSPRDWRVLAHQQVHGLLGQTWQARRYAGAVREIEGEVDDYVIGEDSLHGYEFVYNRFNGVKQA